MKVGGQSKRVLSTNPEEERELGQATEARYGYARWRMARLIGQPMPPWFVAHESVGRGNPILTL